METLATPPADAELHLLTEWGDRNSRVRWRKASVASVLVHIAGIVVLMSLPAGFLDGPPVRRAAPPVHHIITPLIEPLTEFTQKAPNKGKVAKELDVETIQVSVAHAYPGTELYDYAVTNNFLVKGSMVDEGGHQLAHIEYPGLPANEVLHSVHTFYDEYYFRPKAVFRILKKSMFNSADRKRLYKEAKVFLKVRSMRNKQFKKNQAEQAAAVPPREPVQV
jgi:hypothetical protein